MSGYPKLSKLRINDFQKGKKDIVPEPTSTGRKRTVGHDPLTKPFKETINYSERPIRATAKRSRAYYDKVTYPTYSQFQRPEAVDEEGRQYRTADGEDYEMMVSLGVIKRGDPFSSIDLMGKQVLLYVRLNKGSMFKTGPPRVSSSISILHIQSGRLYSGYIQSVEGLEKSSTGRTTISKWKIDGTSSVEIYNNYVSKLPKKYQKESPLLETPPVTREESINE